MPDKLTQLEQRLDKLLAELERLRQENNSLRTEKSGLQEELAEIRQVLNRARLNSGDREEIMRTRLHQVMTRLEELERLSG